jgi:putative NADPH-quinone reductase
MGMYVLAINGSPRKENGVTDLVTRKFLEGAREAGAETETVFLAGMKMADCIGDFQCWFKTPGVCRHKDDVSAVHDKMKRADVLIYATPLYICTMSALMKRFLDRICPLGQPYQTYKDGVCGHPLREGWVQPRTILISVCGFPGLRNFDALTLTFQRLCEVGGTELEAEILFSAFPLLVQEPSPAAEQLEYVRKAGREIVTGSILEETKAGYSRPYIDDPESYCANINQLFENLIASAS